MSISVIWNISYIYFIYLPINLCFTKVYFIGYSLRFTMCIYIYILKIELDSLRTLTFWLLYSMSY